MSLCHYLYTFILESTCQTKDVELLRSYSNYLTSCHKLEVPVETCQLTALTLLNLLTSDNLSDTVSSSLVTVCQLSLNKLTTDQILHEVLKACAMSNNPHELHRLVLVCQELSLPHDFKSSLIDKVEKELNNTDMMKVCIANRNF